MAGDRPLRSHISDREQDKFTTNSQGDTSVSVVGEMDVTNAPPAGYSDFIYTAVEINDTTWTQVPLAPNPDTASFAIQNESGEECRFRRDNLPNDYDYQGWRIINNGEFFFDIKKTATIFVKAKSGIRVIGAMEMLK